MDAIYLHFLDKFLPITPHEIDSNNAIGPYDDDGDTKHYYSPDHEVNRLSKVKRCLQTQRHTPSCS